jgi:hypothetical protein
MDQESELTDLDPEVLRRRIQETRSALTEKWTSLEQALKKTVDVRYQVGQHPWVALGSAVVAGYLLGSLGSALGKTADSKGRDPASADDAAGSAGRDPPKSDSPPAGRSLLSDVSELLAPEIDQLKEMAVSFLIDLLRDLASKAVAEVVELERARFSRPADDNSSHLTQPPAPECAPALGPEEQVPIRKGV